MDMDREPLGDIPNLTKYQVRNTVTRIIPDRLVEWTVGFGDHPPFGHVYGWILDPVNESETEVTNYCDWSERLRPDAFRCDLAGGAGVDAGAVGGESPTAGHGRLMRPRSCAFTGSPPPV